MNHQFAAPLIVDTECMSDTEPPPLMGMHEIHNHPDALDVRKCGPRTFRPQRQRARPKFTGEQNKISSVRCAGEEMMEAENIIEPEENNTETLIDRVSLCLPNFAENSVIHSGDKGFKDVLRQYFPSAESNATERLVLLKEKLRKASTHDFWGILMEEMCDITGSQCGFVAKRMLVDDQDSAVEMPELGAPGSCLRGVAFYINNGTDVKKMYRDYRYHAYGTPYAHMKHDKVFIVPERMTEFVRDNPNNMPWENSEAFIGLPLFTEGKCLAHFGMIWSSEGASKRTLGWSFVEMLLHSLEDMVLQRILEGREFAKEVAPPESTPAKVIPLSAITASQSLKPYARSLSHELRTPMQGVVGMLDIMYSTVLDAMANQQNERVREVFQDLKNHIEVVQDSSKRAVEAADNVVHAYDLDMQMPETPLTPVEWDVTPHLAINTGLLSPTTIRKHERHEDNFSYGPPSKRMFVMAEAEILQKYYQADSAKVYPGGPVLTTTELPQPGSDSIGPSRRSSPIPSMISPTQRRIVTRDFLRTLVTEALQSGHPTSEIHTETDLGEKIEVKTLGSRDQVQERVIHLNVDPDVPEVVITEEQALHFSVQKVIDNAIKFTETGNISVNMKLGKSSQIVEIWVADTGCGIAEESRSSVFTPHFQQDTSRSRSKDGLGLSLFNAKAHVRRNLGGDVTLERSATEGPSKGSEFLIRLPISTLDAAIPLVGTPTPGQYPYCIGTGIDPCGLTSYFLPQTTSSMPGTPDRRRGPSRQTSKHVGFNRNLAKEYPLNILIAEDNAINRNVAVGSLNKLGYSKENITLAFDGVEAVQHYKASLAKPAHERFDAILMDIWMPNMDGYEATTRIMELAKEKDETLKIIAVTADITGDSLDRAKDVGMKGFVAKPYKVLDIENLIIENFGKA